MKNYKIEMAKKATEGKTMKKQLDAFDGLKSELILRGMDSAEADAVAAGWTRMLPDNATLTETEINENADEILAGE